MIDPTTQRNLDIWINADIDTKSRTLLDSLMTDDPQKLTDSFYTKLSFGTGGLRGIMGVGTNRMNAYTVQTATQGLVNYLSTHNKKNSVFIGYDCRHNSRFFAEVAAKVLAGNGIKVYLTKELRPTPYVSFGCRYLGCTAAIMITASHNPPEYNGYKVYWSDGAQVVPPHDTGIIEEVNKITSLKDVKHIETLTHPLITEVLEKIDSAYFDTIEKQQFYPECNRSHGDTLKILYSNLHGTGITLMPEAMKRWGFTNLLPVHSQSAPDGDFPTVKSPNPEEREALSLGITMMEQEDGDILIATDPDADRVGIAVRHQGETHLLNGNQISCLLLYHICQALPQMPPKAAFVKTIGTTELFKEIAQSYGGHCFDVLTGFKYIAELILKWEKNGGEYHYIFGGEESYGYLLGTHARDKDSIISSTLIAEAALQAKLQGKTLVDQLHEIWKKFGVYVENLQSIIFPDTKVGKEQMKKGLEKLKNSPPKSIASIPVKSIENYLTSTKSFMESGKTEAIKLPQSNVLLYWLEDGSKLMIRPSGTEPKMKIYCGVHRKEKDSVKETVKSLESHADKLVNELKKIIS